MINSLIDAGPIIALFDGSDQHHRRVYQFMEHFRGNLITSWPVITEACYMLDFNKKTQLDYLDWITEGGVEIHHIEQWNIVHIRELMATYADLPADLADTTLLHIAEVRNLTQIITLDRDFDIYRTRQGDPLVNLLAKK